jgi:ketosteroid isomerase-like protein
MAEHPNVALLRKGYQAFAEADMATIDELFADDIVWHVGGTGILSGDYKGKEEVIGMFGRLFQETGGSFKIEIHDVLANDEHSVCINTVSGERNGKRFETKGVDVFHPTPDGKVKEYWGLVEDQAALNEIFAE